MADGERKENTSVASRISKASKMSMASTASKFFRFRSSSKSRSSSVEASLAAGDQCETVSIVTIRSGEALESEVINELPLGTPLEILEIGEIPRRAKIRAGAIEGWISVKTRLNEALVTKRSGDVTSACADFEVGGQHEVLSLVTVRAGESLDSDVVTEVKPGTAVKIVELGKVNKRRGKIVSEVGEGWISMTTRQGELLIGKMQSNQGSSGGQSSGTGLFGSSSSKIKVVLEAARCGDLDALTKIVEGSSGIMGKLSGRPNLNCSDIRGKTPLIYASAFGNKKIVEYLISLKKEVDVNQMDDTQKSPLHHASKRARKTRGDSTDQLQADIVKMLLDAGASIEARDHNGCTSLMFAVANGDEAVVRVLVDAGANVNVKDYEGHTPLDYAMNFGYTTLATLLKAHGAQGDELFEEDEKYETDTVVTSEAAPVESEADTAASLADSPDVVAKPKVKAKAKVKKKASPDGSAPKAKGKAKAKAKGKAKAKAKGKAKGAETGGEVKRKSLSMAAMIAEIEAGKDEADGGCPNNVEVLDLKEEADDSEIAIDKLKAILASSIVAAEIEGAIAVAKAAGVDEHHPEIETAEAKVKQLKLKAKTLDRLRQAVEYPSVDELNDAIAAAEKEGIAKAEVDKAKKALQEEIPKQKARDLLREAQSAGDAKKLKAAIAEAKAANVSKDDIEPFEDLLKGAESKEKATAALKDAMASLDVASLKFSIQQAKDAGCDAGDISKAEQILREEEPKAKAREQIAEALDKVPVDCPLLEAAIKAGKDAHLDPSEYADCVDALEREAARAKALAEVKEVLASVKDTDMTDIEAIRTAKTKLSNAINHAKESGVAETDLNDFELRRRKLHNAIEDLKGSIRVFCRVRPLSSKEKAQGDTEVTRQIDNMTLTVQDRDINFAFDAVFLPGTQEEVFEDCRDLVQSACDGYNVTLFAYGQTGAGKTYTMGGTPDNPGVSRRTINEIFRVTEANSSRYEFTILGSMLELYRQDLMDLLAVAKDGRANAKKLQVRSDKAGNVVVEGLNEEECKTPDELDNLLESGMAARKVMATSMNSESSRSHLLFVVKIVSVNRETHERLHGKILIVDLAGSERLSKSGVTGEGAKEAIEINKSLTALGDVIEALTKGAKQIPYRNHKLTMVMQDALGGTAKTLMFVNCSPAASNSDETLMSLKYATRAKMITNKADKKKG